MSGGLFFDGHELEGAFLGSRLERLVSVIERQGQAYLAEGGFRTSARAVSTLLLISDEDAVSIADIARRLHLSHQLVNQRVDLLVEAGLVTRGGDPRDGRRKILSLTEAGGEEVAALRPYLRDARDAYDALDAEIGACVGEIARRACEALNARSLAARVADARARRDAERAQQPKEPT